MGSEHDPLPLGNWTIKGVSHNPEFHYNPDLFWDASSSDSKGVLGPGPNGPVGVVWIDLSKPHYGILGTPEPALIGRTESHGCIDRKSTRLNSSHYCAARMPSSA